MKEKVGRLNHKIRKLETHTNDKQSNDKQSNDDMEIDNLNLQQVQKYMKKNKICYKCGSLIISQLM